MRVLVFALLTLLPVTASAQGFGVRVTPAGLDELSSFAIGQLPTGYLIPDIHHVVHVCEDGDEIAASAPSFAVGFAWHELDLAVGDGTVIVDTVLDVNVATPVTIDNVYGCAGSTTCNLSVAIQRMAVHVELGAATGPDGNIEFHGATISIDVAPEDLELDSEACPIGDLAEGIFESVEAFALDFLLDFLGDTISGRVSEMLGAVFADTLGLTVEREDLTIAGSLDALDLDASQGITLGGDAELTWTGPVVRQGDAPETNDASGDALPYGFEGMFQLAASDRLVTDALYQAWRGGMLSSLLAERSFSYELDSNAISRQIGLSGATRLDIAIDIEEPLTATFGREAPDVAVLNIDGLHVHIDVYPESGPPSGVDIRVGGQLTAELAVDPELGGLVLEIEDLQIGDILIEGANESLEVDRARMARFIETTITPVVQGALSGVPVAPALHGIAGTFIHLRAVESRDGWQRIGADMHTPDPSDAEAPDTFIVDAPDLLAAGTASFPVRGTDNSTPEALIRFRAWLDGTELADGVASGVQAIRFDVTGGEHVLEVAAVDLNDNEDPTRARHVFNVDGTPPELVLIEAPGGILPTRTATVTWEMSDAEGTVEARWELREIHDDGSSTVVDDAPYADYRVSLEVADLQPGQLYEIEVVASDAAGNLTSRTVGFAVDPGLGGGCSASSVGNAAGEGSTPAVALFLLVGLIAVRRRHS